MNSEPRGFVLPYHCPLILWILKSPANNHRWLLKQSWFASASGREECFSGEETVTPLKRLFKRKGVVFSLSQLLSEFTQWLSGRTKENACEPTPIQKLGNKLLQKKTSKIGLTEPSVISKCKFGECTQVLRKYTWEVSVSEYAVLI